MTDLPVPIGAYFGEPWPSGTCDDGERVPTPVGQACALCDEPIEKNHQGTFIYDFREDRTQPPTARPCHKECSLREVLGGIGHHEDHDRWCTREHDPDGGRTYRQSALEVWELMHTSAWRVWP